MSRLIGPYEVIRELGRGGMGTVFLARDPAMGREVAIKVLAAGGVPEDSERFRREALAVAKLRHPAVVTVHELAFDAGHWYLVMDCVVGQSLEERIARGGQLSLDEIVAHTTDLVDALGHAHEQGILHRDLKPANVLLAADGSAVLTDFGLAKDLCTSREALTRTGELLGTPAFMAPEQALAEGAIDVRTDVYGLGATIYAMLTGRPPFKAASVLSVLAQVVDEEPVPPRRLRSDVPAALEAMCLRCLEKDPERRYPSTVALGEDLARFRAGEAVRSSRRTLTPLLLLMVTSCLGVLGTAAWALRSPATVVTPRAEAASVSSEPIPEGSGQLPEVAARVPDTVDPVPEETPKTVADLLPPVAFGEPEVVAGLRIRALAGDVHAVAKLGHMWFEGEGGLNESVLVGAALLNAAAELGYGRAGARLGGALLPGRPGLVADVERGLALLERAHGLPDREPSATSTLGDVYRFGLYGIPQDLDRAFKIFSEGERSGDGDILFALGDLYRQGGGVKQDVSKAVEYYRRAALAEKQEALLTLGELIVTERDAGRALLDDEDWLRGRVVAGHPNAWWVLAKTVMGDRIDPLQPKSFQLFDGKLAVSNAALDLRVNGERLLTVPSKGDVALRFSAKTELARIWLVWTLADTTRSHVVQLMEPGTADGKQILSYTVRLDEGAPGHWIFVGEDTTGGYTNLVFLRNE